MLVESDEGQVGPHRVVACGIGARFTLDSDANLHRGSPSAVHLSAQHDDIPQLDRVVEVHAVDRGGHGWAPSMASGGDAAGHVNPLQDLAAKGRSQGIGVTGHHQLRHFHARDMRALAVEWTDH